MAYPVTSGITILTTRTHTKVVGRFDFVMANPPFNVSGVDKERVREDNRFALGVPSTDNANYLWIQQFYHALNDHGRAGLSWQTLQQMPGEPRWRSGRS